MTLVFFFLKLFPVFGIAIGVILFDLARSFKRKGNKTWIGMIFFGLLNFAAVGGWIYLRGDRNADIWFSRLVTWLHHG